MWFLELKLWNHRQKAWFIFPKLPTSNPENHGGQKRWKVLSKLPIISLWEWPEEPAWVLSRNNIVKEFIPHGEWAGNSLFSDGLATDQLYPLLHFPGEKKSLLFHLVEYMYLDKMPVFCDHHHYLLWGAFGIFLRAEILLKVGFSCLGFLFGSLTHNRLLTEMFKWPWSLEPRGNSPAKQDQGWKAKVPRLGCGRA